jgi:hypothetical protein
MSGSGSKAIVDVFKLATEKDPEKFPDNLGSSMQSIGTLAMAFGGP